jgi:hypothetical protein
MTPTHIELFVDRLCGYFPTDSIARNTVKAAWCKEDALLDASEHDGHLALNVLQNDAKFPNLARVKAVLRQWQLSRQPEDGCGKCLSGWVYVQPIEENGITYRQVSRCKCSGGTTEPSTMKEEWVNA